MLSFSHPGLSAVSPLFECRFKVNLRSAVLSVDQASVGALSNASHNQLEEEGFLVS